MTAYDLLLTQVTAGGTDFAEKYINITKGSILSADVAGTPTVLAPGTNTYMLVADDTTTTGLKWQAIAGGHTQNTDSGTTNVSFTIDSDGYILPITAESATKLGFKVNAGTYADIQAKDATFARASDDGSAPTAGAHLTNKTYVDNLLAANDAMVFKGTIGSLGTHEIIAFNSLSTYNAGWTYRVITAGTIRGYVCEIGDLVIALVDRAGLSASDADWTVSQTNIDGAVTGPSSATDNNLVAFNGTTGKIVKDSGLLTATIANKVTAPGAYNAAGTVNQFSYDGLFFYICTATGTTGNAVWKRTPLASNWTAS